MPNIAAKIGKYLQGFKITIEPVEVTRPHQGGAEVEEYFDATIKKGNVVLANKEFNTEKQAQMWADNFIRKYGEMHRKT